MTQARLKNSFDICQRHFSYHRWIETGIIYKLLTPFLDKSNLSNVYGSTVTDIPLMVKMSNNVSYKLQT